MASLLSPQVFTKETDTTTIVPAVSSTEGGIAGQFNWGPVNRPFFISSENELVKVFQKPDNANADDWWTAANFLAYSNKLYVVRVVNEAADVAILGSGGAPVNDANGNPTFTSTRAKNAIAAVNNVGVLVRNEDEYEHQYNSGNALNLNLTGPWIAKFPGALGNSLKVSICASPAAFESSLTNVPDPADPTDPSYTPGTVTVAKGGTTVTGTGVTPTHLPNGFQDLITEGDWIVINKEAHRVARVVSPTVLELRTKHVSGASNAQALRRWEYYTLVDRAPDTTASTEAMGGTGDEMHIVIVDKDGRWTGSKGTVLEVFQAVSASVDGKLDDGTNNYYKNVVNRGSKYVWWAGHDGNLVDAGAQGTVDFEVYGKPLVYALAGGQNGANIDEEQKIPGYNLFLKAEDIDVSFILGAAANQTIAVHIINNITEVRKDCVAFFSPPRDYVVNNEGEEAEACVTFRNSLPSTSYATLDGNWKFQYDTYNDVYRYVPCNGDTAGLYARTDNERDAWWAAAGFNRGHIKNAIKLAWNPKLADRDILYKNGINPIVSFQGEGPVLYGNKTLLAKPSAFDRMNVRRLFIVLEKAISKAAQYTLFEFNDEFTRAQFRNLVEPFLRDVKGRRGIEDFLVVCDETNNTPEIINSNQFKGDIYIKPARTAEFITLNFVAVKSGVDFTEVVGRTG